MRDTQRIKLLRAFTTYDERLTRRELIERTGVTDVGLLRELVDGDFFKTEWRPHKQTVYSLGERGVKRRNELAQQLRLT